MDLHGYLLADLALLVFFIPDREAIVVHTNHFVEN